jgi:hypothetical protein
MRTIRVAITGLMLSLVAAASVSASPFTAIGLPLVYGQETPQPTNWWMTIVQTACDQLRILATPRVIDAGQQAAPSAEVAPVAPTE